MAHQLTDSVGNRHDVELVLMGRGDKAMLVCPNSGECLAKAEINDGVFDLLHFFPSFEEATVAAEFEAIVKEEAE